MLHHRIIANGKKHRNKEVMHKRGNIGDGRHHHHHEKIIRTAEKRPKCVALEMEARRFHHTTQKYKIQSLLLVCAVKSY